MARSRTLHAPGARFAHPLLQRVYEQILKNPPLRDGKPYRGNSTATAFSDGVRGQRTLHSVKGTVASAVFEAGRTWGRAQERKARKEAKHD